nr:MAG TPA: hypothetical protein [Caudoviricetes sp.]
MEKLIMEELERMDDDFMRIAPVVDEQLREDVFMILGELVRLL